MDYDDLVALREQHPAWRLLRRDHAPLVLAFCGRHFVEENHGPTPVGVLATALDDLLYALNAPDPDRPVFPRPATEYLDDWAGDDAGWLRRFYPLGSDEVHYDATPAFEKAYAWVSGLQMRPFVGTESRLQTVIDLLRQMVHGSETDPEARLAELRRRRDEIDAEIAAAEAGRIDVLAPVAVRERYQQFATTARELLADFREVEENFRALDRTTRERMAAWDGGKGDLLADLVGTRSQIDGSDQGRSFQAFYDLLLSRARQDELSDLLHRVGELDDVRVDRRLRHVNHDWAEAAERTQQTVRQISEQLRRFLDDRVWLENRRVGELIRAIEASALTVRNDPPPLGLAVDVPGIPIVMPLERPLYDARPFSRIDDLVDPGAREDVDTTALLAQPFIDQKRLADHVRATVPPQGSALLEDLVGLYPIEQGAAEIVGYLALADDDIEVALDDAGETVIDYVESGVRRRARLPRVTVSRT